MSVHARQAPAGSDRRALPFAVTASVVLTVIAGGAIQGGAGIGLGTPLPPFLFRFSPVVGWPVLAAVAVAGGCIGMAPLVIRWRCRRPAFAAAAYALSLAVGLSVNVARRGTVGWSYVFDLGAHGSPEASHEYLPALSATRHGVGSYISHFATLLSSLPTHAKGNPPGPVVAMQLLGLNTPSRLAAACILGGSLCAPFAYGLGTTLGDELRGRQTAMLTVFSPALVLFGVTSVDYVFAALGTATAWLMVTPGRRSRLAGCALAAVGSFASWLLLAIPAWAVLVVLQRRGRRPAAWLAGSAAVAITAFTAALVVGFGYDPAAVLTALDHAYRGGAAAQRPYLFWLLGSPAAWLVMIGPVIAWLSVRALANRDPAAVSLAAIVAFGAVAGFTKAETERIWLPFVPLACAAAAVTPIRRLRSGLALLAVQAVVIETLFATKW